MEYHQTICTNEEGVRAVAEDLNLYARSLVRNSPLSVIKTEEPLGAKVPFTVVRFHVVLDQDFGDYDIRSEKQADKLIDAMRKLADEVRKANDWNYVVPDIQKKDPRR